MLSSDTPIYPRERRSRGPRPAGPDLHRYKTEFSAASWPRISAVSQTTKKDERTFVEVVGAHGVSDHGWQVLQLRGALQQLAGHSLVQLGAPDDDFTQNHLFELGAEGVIHCFVCDHHCPWCQTYSQNHNTLVQINHTHNHFEHNSQRKSRFLPTPPDVPRRKRITSRHWAWCSSLMSSCSMMEMEGTPIPCYNGEIWREWLEERKYAGHFTVDGASEALTLIERTGPTLYMQYRSVPSHISLSSSGFPGRLSSWCMNWAKAFIRFGLPPTHTN